MFSKMRLDNVRQASLVLATVAILLIPLFAVISHLMGFEGVKEVGALLVFHFGFGVAMLLVHSALSQVYEVMTFHLYGWNGGHYAVKLEVCLLQGGEAVLRPHDHKIFHLGERVARHCPRAPEWRQVVGKPNEIILLDGIFRLETGMIETV